MVGGLLKHMLLSLNPVDVLQENWGGKVAITLKGVAIILKGSNYSEGGSNYSEGGSNYSEGVAISYKVVLHTSHASVTIIMTLYIERKARIEHSFTRA